MQGVWLGLRLVVSKAKVAKVRAPSGGFRASCSMTSYLVCLWEPHDPKYSQSLAPRVRRYEENSGEQPTRNWHCVRGSGRAADSVAEKMGNAQCMLSPLLNPDADEDVVQCTVKASNS